MAHLTPIYNETLDINYLANYLNRIQVVLHPKSMAYLSAIWSTLNPADQGNLLSAIKRESVSEVQLTESFILKQDMLKQVLIDLNIISATEARTVDLLILHLAQSGWWKQAWDISRLEGKVSGDVTMFDWMSQTKLKLLQSHKAVNH